MYYCRLVVFMPFVVIRTNAACAPRWTQPAPRPQRDAILYYKMLEYIIVYYTIVVYYTIISYTIIQGLARVEALPAIDRPRRHEVVGRGHELVRAADMNGVAQVAACGCCDLRLVTTSCPPRRKKVRRRKREAVLMRFLVNAFLSMRCFGFLRGVTISSLRFLLISSSD